MTVQPWNVPPTPIEPVDPAAGVTSPREVAIQRLMELYPWHPGARLDDRQRAERVLESIIAAVKVELEKENAA